MGVLRAKAQLFGTEQYHSGKPKEKVVFSYVVSCLLEHVQFLSVFRFLSRKLIRSHNDELKEESFGSLSLTISRFT